MNEENPNKEMILAFAQWRQAQEKIRIIEMAKEEYNAAADKRIQEMTLIEVDARLAVEAIMKKNGVTEDILPGSSCDYKLNFRQMPETVNIPDEKAVPDKFMKEETKKTVKKKELLKHLKELRDKDQPLPNWVKIERKPSKLEWELIKK